MTKSPKNHFGGIGALGVNRKRNKGLLENLQLGKYGLLEIFPINIILLMLMDYNIGREWKALW
jgi:hypothetical protein